MNYLSKARLLAGVALAFGGIAAALPAQAQDQPAKAEQKDAPVSDDIVVTAQFREQRLQDTPISITAISADTLEAREQRSVSDLGRFAPNVSLSPAGQFFGNSISAYIRGVGQSNSNFAYEPGVGMYIDDVYYGTTFGAVFDLTDLERVEIPRGPQGTLAGKNSVGGSVKLFTRKPDDTASGFIEGTYGRFNRIDVRGSANIALSDNLFVRLSGVSKSSDGYMTRLDFGCANPGGGIPPRAPGKTCKIGTEGGGSLDALRLALRYVPSDTIEVNLSADVARDRSGSVASKLIRSNSARSRTYDPALATGGVPFDGRFVTPDGRYTNYATYCNGGNFTTLFGTTRQLPTTTCVSPTSNVDSYGFAGTFDVKLSDQMTLKSITAYRHASGDNGIDIDGSPIGVYQQHQYLRHNQFTQELRLSGTVSDLLTYTVGGFYYDARDKLQIHLEIPIVLFDFQSDDPVTNTSKSAFAHLELTPLPGLTLLGGVRYTHDRKTYSFSRRNTDGSPISGIPLTPNFLIAGLDGMTSGYTENRFDYRIGANYRINESLMVYAQVATGYKGGGINPTPNVADQIRPFGSEQVTAYEAGFKANSRGNIFTLNGAAFFNDYKDIQTILLSCPPSVSPICSLPANAGDAHVKGAELELSARPLDGLKIEGNVGYLDFEYVKVNPVTGVTLAMTAPYISKWQASGGVEYRSDIGKAGSLSTRVDVSYLSSFFSSVPNSPDTRVEGRTLVDARVTFETPDSDWSVSAGVRNLFNKYYYTTIGRYADFGILTGVVGRPREWSVTLKRRF